MQTLGTWITPEGAIEATLYLESEVPDDMLAQELPGWLSGALSGAATGAVTGTAAGPWGALIGGVAGAAIGGATSASKPAPPRPPQAPAGSRPSAPSRPSGGASPTDAIRALQQFAAAVPALIQLVGAAGGRRESFAGESVDQQLAENSELDGVEWTSASENESAWSIP